MLSYQTIGVALLIYLSIQLTAQAHNIVGGAYVDGQTIEGEIGFSNGDMALPGVLVEVFNEAGDKLGETKIQQDGLFIYPVKQLTTHIFKADLSAGHVIDIKVEADELNKPIKTNTAKTDTNSPIGTSHDAANQSTNTMQQATIASALLASSPSALNHTATTTITIAPQALEQLIGNTVRQAVAKQVKPLQKDLRAYKEKVMLRDIAGGIGFIFGIFGVAAWMASRKQAT